MIKKTLVLSLSFIMIVATLVSCGADNDDSSNLGNSSMNSSLNSSMNSSINSSSNIGNNSNNTGEYKDGTYTAEVKNPIDGYYDYVKITIKDKAVSGMEFDSKNDKGEYLTADENYKKSLKDKGNKNYPDIYYTEYAKNYILNGDIEKVDIIDGTESVYNNFKELVNGALNNAKNGIEDIFYFDNEVNK